MSKSKKQVEVYIARYRKTKNYKRAMARALMGKPVRAFIALRRQHAFIENPVIIDLQQPHQS
jgi:hypothetical protein